MNIKKLYERLEEINKELMLEYNDGETNWASNLETEKERIEEAICILEENEIENVDEIIVSNIKWVTDGEDVDLPKKVIIKVAIDNANLLEDIDGYADELSDYISDTYEFLNAGFKVKYK